MDIQNRKLLFYTNQSSVATVFKGQFITYFYHMMFIACLSKIILKDHKDHKTYYLSKFVKPKFPQPDRTYVCSNKWLLFSLKILRKVQNFMINKFLWRKSELMAAVRLNRNMSLTEILSALLYSACILQISRCPCYFF